MIQLNANLLVFLLRNTLKDVRYGIWGMGSSLYDIFHWVDSLPFIPFLYFHLSLTTYHLLLTICTMVK